MFVTGIIARVLAITEENATALRSEGELWNASDRWYQLFTTIIPNEGVPPEDIYADVRSGAAQRLPFASVSQRETISAHLAALL